jgi:imidazolonepropionase-like amidohydrolase
MIWFFFGFWGMKNATSLTILLAFFAGCSSSGTTIKEDASIGDTIEEEKDRVGEVQTDNDSLVEDDKAQGGFDYNEAVSEDSSNDRGTVDSGFLDVNPGDANDVSDTGDVFVPPIEDCPNPPIPAPSSGSCSISGSGAFILIRGDVLKEKKILHNGEVLIDGQGFIRCAGCDCSKETGYDSATRLDCAYGLVSPALINPHDHITYTGNYPATITNERYEHRHQWRKGLDGHTKITVPSTSNAVSFGELRQVMSGTVSLFGSGGSAGLLRNLDGNLEGLDPALKATYDTFPLGDSSGVMLTNSCAYPDIQSEQSVAGMHAYVPHVAEGINDAARNEFLCLSQNTNGGQDLVRANTSFIHGVGVTLEDIRDMAIDGTGLVWSPRSNIALYGMTAPVTIYKTLGVTIALGTDWTATGSVNMLRELKCADSYNKTNLNGFFTDMELVAMATIDAAKVLHVDTVIGKLEAGYLADIAIFSTRERKDERAIIDAGVEDVVLVLRAGIPLYGDEALVRGLIDVSNCEVLDVCGVSKIVCAKRETGKTINELKSSSGNPLYPLFFCNVPENEPTCVPFRQGEFDGIPKANDADGDGVLDDADNCPHIFNPPRPMDKGRQPDYDKDGVGDDCDPCPFDAGISGCSNSFPDKDGDGVENDKDNCPDVKNPNQEDSDMDGVGDACDPCPTRPNPNGAPCDVTIWEAKTLFVPLGTKVRIQNALVTGVGQKNGNKLGFFIQMTPSDAGYQGQGFSGIYVYYPSGAQQVEASKRVTVVGVLQDYYGETQIAQVSSFQILSNDATVLEPVVVNPSEVSTNGQKWKDYDAVLVRVLDVTVTEAEPPAGPGDSAPTNEFVVDNSLRVNDFIFLIDPLPQVGTRFSSITGILHFANGNSKLEPRSASDFVLAQ